MTFFFLSISESFPSILNHDGFMALSCCRLQPSLPKRLTPSLIRKMLLTLGDAPTPESALLPPLHPSHWWKEDSHSEQTWKPRSKACSNAMPTHSQRSQTQSAIPSIHNNLGQWEITQQRLQNDWFALLGCFSPPGWYSLTELQYWAFLK